MNNSNNSSSDQKNFPVSAAAVHAIAAPATSTISNSLSTAVPVEAASAIGTTYPSGALECKRVLILYTGGTMGMRLDSKGHLAPTKGYLTEQLQNLPELRSAEMPLLTIKEYDDLIDSACMGPSQWKQMAQDIEDSYLQFDGFVVIMGTDTMAYAASAMAFMLENLGKTVVFTGSQIPFYEVYNDARRNLIVSVLFAANSDIPEVCVCFNDKLLRACRTVKVDSSSLDAFHTPNYPPLATLGARIQLNHQLLRPAPRGALRVHKALDSKVIVLKLVPGFDDSSIDAMIVHSSSLRAIVLELYGTGNGPSKKQSLIAAIAAAVKRGIVVVALSQCLRGGVSLEKYSMGRAFQDAGVISGQDMTTEACTTKLAYLCGRLTDPGVISRFLTADLRGELTVAAEQESDSLKAMSSRVLSKL